MTDFSLPGGVSGSSASKAPSIPLRRKKFHGGRLASAALACGVLFVVCLIACIITHPNIPGALLLAIVAFPLGGVVLGGISQVTPRVHSKGRSVGGIVGVICLMVMVFLVGATLLLPSLCRPREAALVAKCRSNLKNLYAAILQYQNTHGGAYPPSLDALVAEGMSPALLVCPASNDTMATGSNSDEIIHNLHSETFHQSYVYLPPTSATPPDNAVLIYEHLHDHRHAHLHVLFCNGEVKLLTKQEADALVPGLAKMQDNEPY